jgi:hypothetical protein
MRTSRVIVVLLATTGAAYAQRNAIDIKLRWAGETQWLDILDIVGPDDRNIEVGVFYERSTGFGFAGSVHNIVINNWATDDGDQVFLLDRPDSTQHPDGRQGRFNFGAQRQAAYSTGADMGSLRIAAANNTQNVIAGGISVRQNTPVASGSLFDTGDPVLGFRFNLRLASPRFQSYHIFTPADRVHSFTVFTSESSTSGTNLPLSSVVLDGAIIRYIPSPSSAWFAMLALTLTRRQRRSNNSIAARIFS